MNAQENNKTCKRPKKIIIVHKISSDIDQNISQSFRKGRKVLFSQRIVKWIVWVIEAEGYFDHRFFHQITHIAKSENSWFGYFPTPFDNMRHVMILSHYKVTILWETMVLLNLIHIKPAVDERLLVKYAGRKKLPNRYFG